MLLSDFIQARREKRIEAAKIEGIAEGIAEGEGLIASSRGIVAERKQRHEARSSQNRPQHSRRNNHRRNQKNNLIMGRQSKLATLFFMETLSLVPAVRYLSPLPRHS